MKGCLDRFQGSAETVSVNDFSTLYTLFDHEHLIGNIRWLLGRLSENSGKKFVRVTYGGAFWVWDDKGEGTYSLVDLGEMLDFLVRNSYVKAFGRIFRQCKGIIMGGKSSGWLSDCSLMVDEFRYIDNRKSNQLDLVRSFRGLSRYRDDCTALNIPDFRELARDIYPASLSLSQENDSLDFANVLDMSVSVCEGNFVTKVYNKTDSFPFDVISLPFISSNISRDVCYLVFYSQVLRYQRLTSYLVDIEDRVRQLADILLGRNYIRGRLRRQFCRVISKYRSEFERWDIPAVSGVWFDNIVLTSNSLTIS